MYRDAIVLGLHTDCGAGVGRVAEQLLLHHFAIVDLIEPSQHLIGAAKRNLAMPGRGEYPKGHQAGQFFNMGLQAWTPEAGRYCSIQCKKDYLSSHVSKLQPGDTTVGPLKC